jgi:hypothetical protein
MEDLHLTTQIALQDGMTYRIENVYSKVPIGFENELGATPASALLIHILTFSMILSHLFWGGRG